MQLLTVRLIVFAAYGAVNCYTCNSRNRTTSACHDPFHPINATYVQACKVPKEHHIGLFPAAFCVKGDLARTQLTDRDRRHSAVIGVTEGSNEEIVIRACSLENMDNQCGKFKFQGESFVAISWSWTSLLHYRRNGTWLHLDLQYRRL